MTTLLARPHDAVTELGQASALPRLAPAMARAASRLVSGCAPLAMTLRGAPWRLQWQAASPHAAQRECFGFRLGPHAGRVGIDALALAVLLDERRSDLLPRELRCVLWADAMHPVAHALERLTRLRFEWLLPQDGAEDAEEPAHAVHFELASVKGGERFEGFVHFDDAAALDSVLAPIALPARAASRTLGALRIPLPFCLGHTHITLREVAAIRPGDIVSIEEWASSGAALLVSADLGATGRRLVGLAEGSHITIQQTKELAMNRDTPEATAAPDDGGAAPLPLDRLDALEVSLRFEVGELSLSLGELKAMRAGHVFDLGQPLNRSTVRILAHGNVLGKGHLVAVGDRLGVRVSEFAPSEI